jgi:iron complex outermembrane recepter protein
MRKNRVALALALACPCALPCWAQALSPGPVSASEAPVKTLGIVTINSGQPTSLPTQIPTTIEGVTREQIEQTVNATDAEDALKFFPSLLVRRRYIGDYNHAVLSSRASGTGNSARSAVYADGILLSNYLGNGATYTPRWGMVTPEEIERVDVMYGPFSAAYPGNSVGAVVDYVTRMPTQFEGHAKLSAFTQNFSMYNTNETYNGSQASASLGSKSGDWSWWINANHTDSAGQPLVFATKLNTATTAGPSLGAVSGAVAALDKTNAPWYILGTTTQYHTTTDPERLKHWATGPMRRTAHRCLICAMLPAMQCMGASARSTARFIKSTACSVPPRKALSITCMGSLSRATPKAYGIGRWLPACMTMRVT